MSRRIRTIRPEVLIDDEAMAEMSDAAWRLWVGVRLIADDYGNAPAGDRFLAGRIWQDTGKAKRVAAAREELAKLGRVSTYTADGQLFLTIVGWHEEQRQDRKSEHTRNPSPDHPFKVTSGKPVPVSIEIIRDVRRVFAASRGESPPVAATHGEKPRVAVARGRDPDLGSGSGIGSGTPLPPAGPSPVVFQVPDCYATAYAKGIERGSGAPCSRPSSRADVDRLVNIVTAHARTDDGRLLSAADEVCQWLERTAETYAGSRDERGNPNKIGTYFFEAWLNGGRRAPAPRPGVQTAAGTWTPKAQPKETEHG